MSILAEICEKKREHIAAQKTKTTLEDLKAKIQNQSPPRGFLNAMKKDSPGAIIAEVKKSSPSKGVLREDFDPVQIAKDYESAGATCLSVLTDEPYFQGKDGYLKQIRQNVTLPLLRKDFMLDIYQIYESRALGADCILLIMAALEDSEAKELYNCAQNLGMDVLTEIHNAEELEHALNLNPHMIGVNNRNLKTLEVDIQTSFDLIKAIPEDSFKISESGLGKSETLAELTHAGYEGFLIGEAFMIEKDIQRTLQKIKGWT